MPDPERFRPPDQDPDEFREDFREAVLLLGLDYVERYRDAGCPYGRTVEGMLLWMTGARPGATDDGAAQARSQRRSGACYAVAPWRLTRGCQR